MKFDITHEVLKSAHPTSVHKSAETRDKGFGKILEESIQTSSAVNTPRDESLGIGNLLGMQMQPLSPLNDASVYEGTEQLLDKLDEYRKRLGDKQVEIGDIKTLIHEITSRLEQLKQETGVLSEGHPLREIANQALIVSSLEVMRFTRGDYDSM